MKLVDVVQITRDAIAQAMGDDYQPLIDSETGDPISNSDLADLPSQKLVDIGQDVTGEETINALNTGLISRLGKHVIENRLYTTKLPSLYIDAIDWGGFLERTRVGLGEIMADPMYNKIAGTSYADIEHTFYGQDVHSKIFEEGKSIMVPFSTEREMLRDAFTSWDKMNSFLSARLQKIKSTINLALSVYEKMVLGCAIAISDIKNESARHLITEAVALGIIDQITVEGQAARNPTYDEVKRDPNFQAYVIEVIKNLKGDLGDVPSTAFNDGTIPTWCDEDPKLIMLNDFVSCTDLYLKANTFNPENLGIGAVDTINSWQGIKATDLDTTEHYFEAKEKTTVMIAADASGKIGQTTKYEKSGIIGLMFDPMAIGISLMRNKVTSSYTACADFWNDFNHQLVNYIVDSSYGMVALIAE